jgi:signal transduction histidine kinase
VQLALANITNALSRAGRTRAEYLASPDAARLNNYRVAISQIAPAIANAQALTIDNPLQQRNFSQLAELADKRSAILRLSVAEAGRAKVGVGTQARLSENQQMYGEEQRLLESRIRRRTDAAKLAVASVVLTFLIAARCSSSLIALDKQLVERQKAQAALQKLSGKILNLQDEERRKFSRELHDSMGQLLVSIKMNLDLLAMSQPDNSSITNCCELLEQALRETRTISYLLHPSLLDQAGFGLAAREYVEGFSQRSGIAMEINLSEEGIRLPAPFELAMFRVLEESLTNILKHSSSSQATITLSYSPSQAMLSIRDNGGGMPAKILQDFHNNSASLAVGLAGMTERIRQLKG